ncbi:MAG: hypothetical protein RIR69_1136, partial [Actinomycetota bacterium]
MLTHSRVIIPYRQRMGMIRARCVLAVLVMGLSACTEPQQSDEA